MPCILAVRKSECSDEDKQICLTYHGKGGKCDMMRQCKRVLLLNPLCFNEGNVCRNFEIKKINGKEYILYYCDKSCKNFVHKHAEKLLRDIKRDDIITGKELKKLLKNIKTPQSTSKSSGNKEIECIKFIINSVRM